MSDLTPQESAALRDRVLKGVVSVDTRRRAVSRAVAVSSAVAVVAVLTVGVGVFALGQRDGTVAEPVPTATPTPTPDPTRTPTPDPTSTPPSPTTPPPIPTPPPVVLESGDLIEDDAQWQLIAERGWGSWYMSDGTHVATDPALPLPPAVADDIQARVDAIPNNTLDQASTDYTTALIASHALAEQVKAMTYKDVVMLRYNVMSVPIDPADPSRERWYARATQSGWWMPLELDREVLRAAVDEWIAANTAPNSWVVFVGPGPQLAAE